MPCWEISFSHSTQKYDFEFIANNGTLNCMEKTEA